VTSAENPACPLCAARTTRHLLHWKARDIHRCAECTTLFTEPLPSTRELHEFYQSFSFKKPRPEQVRRFLGERRSELRALFDWSGAMAGRSFLDQGGGAGVAYAAARDFGLDSHFGDINEGAIDFVRTTFGLPEERLVRDLSQHSGTFDYILSDNVIEHVPDPRAFLRELLARLAPGGTAIIKTPNAAANEMYFYPRLAYQYAAQAAQYNGWRRSLDMLLFHPVWACDPPRHLYSFSPASFTWLAESLGVPRERYAIEFYWTPLFANTFTERALQPRRNLLGQLRRATLAPVLPLELASKVGQLAARRLGWLEPGGLILRVTKPPSSAASS